MIKKSIMIFGVSTLVMLIFYLVHNVKYTYGRDYIVNTTKLALQGELKKILSVRSFQASDIIEIQSNIKHYDLIFQNKKDLCFGLFEKCIVAKSHEIHEGRRDIEVISVKTDPVKIVRVCSMVLPSFTSWIGTFINAYPNDCDKYMDTKYNEDSRL